MTVRFTDLHCDPTRAEADVTITDVAAVREHWESALAAFKPRWRFHRRQGEHYIFVGSQFPYPVRLVPVAKYWASAGMDVQL